MPGSKKKKLSSTLLVKELARERIGTPPPERTLPDEKAKAERRASKHKITLSALLDATKDQSHNIEDADEITCS